MKTIVYRFSIALIVCLFSSLSLSMAQNEEKLSAPSTQTEIQEAEDPTLFVNQTVNYVDPETYKVTGSVNVHDGETPVSKINELEYVNGRVYANIWYTDLIAIIDPRDGRVAGWADLTGLLASQEYKGPVDILNGIAYDAKNDRLFVTGKYWPYLFEIKLISKE